MEACNVYYWDICIFIAYSKNERVQYGKCFEDIAQYLDEAKAFGTWKIYTSTLTIAEVPKNRPKSYAAFSTFRDFLDDYRDVVIPIPPDPNIMELAADLHGMKYTKISGSRKLEAPDSTHLASAILLQRGYGGMLDAFHTFDNGGQRSIGGCAVPLLTYETCCEQCLREPAIQGAISLNRRKPEHLAPRLISTPP